MNVREILIAEAGVLARLVGITVILHLVWTYVLGGPVMTIQTVGSAVVVGLVLANGLFLFAKYRHPEWILLLNGPESEGDSDA